MKTNMQRLLSFETSPAETVVNALARGTRAATTNPVTATGVTVVKVLTNPFKKNRTSAKEAYFGVRKHALWIDELDDQIRMCHNCDAGNYGVMTRWHRAGTVGHLSGKVYDRNTFCDEHREDAFKAQHIIMESDPERYGL